MSQQLKLDGPFSPFISPQYGYQIGYQANSTPMLQKKFAKPTRSIYSGPNTRGIYTSIWARPFFDNFPDQLTFNRLIMKWCAEYWNTFSHQGDWEALGGQFTNTNHDGATITYDGFQLFMYYAHWYNKYSVISSGAYPPVEFGQQFIVVPGAPGAIDTQPVCSFFSASLDQSGNLNAKVDVPDVSANYTPLVPSAVSITSPYRSNGKTAPRYIVPAYNWQNAGGDPSTRYTLYNCTLPFKKRPGFTLVTLKVSFFPAEDYVNYPPHVAWPADAFTTIRIS